MRITVLFFASLAEVTGTRAVELDPARFTDVESIFASFAARLPALRLLRSTVLCAVNGEFARFASPVSDGDEVAFFPPVSGG